jgi:hypothetical protein
MDSDGPSGSREAQHLDTPNILHVHDVSDERTSYVPCLQLLLTVWAGRVTINILPDDVLLLIFFFDVLDDIYWAAQTFYREWRLSWHRLVHVCQRWRSLVFSSPKFLDLRLICAPATRVELTSIWPPLPIIIRSVNAWFLPEDYDFDAAIVHPSRVSEIDLFLTSSQLRRLVSAMQVQFPALKHLRLDFDRFDKSPVPVLSDGFLGGSAPNLQSLELYSIPFPTLPKLLLSAISLTRLTLSTIPHSGYISPEMIVTGLAATANLKSLTIEFEPFPSRPDQEHQSPPPPTRTVLPALTRFEFKGESEYLEDVVSRIDAPILDTTCITFYQLIFDIPQLTQFVRRTTRFEVLNEVHVNLDYYGVKVGNLPLTRNRDKMSGLRISASRIDMNRWHLSLAQFFTSVFPFIYMVKHIYIYGPQYLPSEWEVDIEDIQWLEIFHPFAALKNLYLSEVLALRIGSALRKLVGGRVTEVLPTLQNIYLEGLQPSGHIQEAIDKFIAARQLSGHPITISLWVKDSDSGWESDGYSDY